MYYDVAPIQEGSVEWDLDAFELEGQTALQNSRENR